MLIRPAIRNDVPAILRIYNEAVKHTTASFDYDPQPLALRMRWFDDHTKSGHPVFVACDTHGHIVGWSSLSKFRERPGYRFTAEDAVYVEAKQRGRGVGKLLVAPLIDCAREMKLATILAAVDANNEASLRLHRGFGYQQVAYLQRLGFKFDRWIDVVYLQLML